jgi:phosphatidylglycerophosphate synthase
MGEDGPSAAVSARIIGECTVALWGLSAFERLRRQFAAIGITDVAPAGSEVAPGGTTILVRADWLYEQRTVADLFTHRPVVVSHDGTPVAAHVGAALVAETIAFLDGASATAPAGVATTTVADLSPAFNEKLRSAEPPRLLPVRAGRRAALERHLFDGAYKGITDIVTKWVWPAPARAVVRLCAAAGVSPNAVTISSVVLVVAATGLFRHGYYWPGLVCGWLMTFFDTVDGKLARVTVHATRIGHALDKGTDLIHPPIWYIAWGYGLQAHGGRPAAEYFDVYVVILVGYIAGRLIEGCFKLTLGDFALYTWQPLDAWVRLLIARRNPNLILLTLALVAGRPDVGLYAVAAWTALSTVYLAARLLQGIFRRLTRGPLESWLASVTDDDDRLSTRVFARRELPADLRAI